MSEHRHEIVMRWADLDALSHVNNVVYLAYAADARAVATGLPSGPMGTMEVKFLRPVLLSERPVVVFTGVDGDRVTQVITVDGDDRPCAEVVTEFGRFAAPAPALGAARTLAMPVRPSDLGADGHVTDVQLVEILQESRMPFIGSVAPGLGAGDFVIAVLRMRCHGPVALGPGPLEVRLAVSRVGASSFDVDVQLTRDGEALVSSSAVLVAFDGRSQRARRLDEQSHAQLSAACREGSISPASSP